MGKQPFKPIKEDLGTIDKKKGLCTFNLFHNTIFIWAIMRFAKSDNPFVFLSRMNVHLESGEGIAQRTKHPLSYQEFIS